MKNFIETLNDNEKELFQAELTFAIAIGMSKEDAEAQAIAKVTSTKEAINDGSFHFNF